MARLKTLIVGASGYIGKPLYKKALTVSDAVGMSSHSVPGLVFLDLERVNEFSYQLIPPESYVFMLAAISSPDICAREPERVRSVNVNGTLEFISKVIACGCRVIFFSSDTVYGDREVEFIETAECNPAGEYAVMKHEVERQFEGEPSFKSARLSYVFSRDDKITRYLVNCAERNEEAELFHPFFRAIIHRDDVIDGALGLAQHWNDFPGQVFNFGGPEILSRVDFAERLRQVAFPGLKYRVTQPEDAFFKNRPRKIAMHSTSLSKILGRPLRNLKEAMDIEFINYGALKKGVSI